MNVIAKYRIDAGIFKESTSISTGDEYKYVAKLLVSICIGNLTSCSSTLAQFI